MIEKDISFQKKKYALLDNNKIKISDLKKDEINSFSMNKNIKAGIFFVDGEIVIYNLTCPHLGGDLSKGIMDKNKKTIQCPWHGYCYNLGDGSFNSNPNIEFTVKAREKSKYFNPDYRVPARLRKINFTSDDVSIKISN